MIIKRIIENRGKWRKKYNTLCVKYETLASEKIEQLDQNQEILLQSLKYREEIDNLKNELQKYKRRYGSIRETTKKKGKR